MSGKMKKSKKGHPKELKHSKTDSFADLTIPNESELQKQFEALLVEIGAGLDDDKKMKFREFPNETKWLMICQHKKKEQLLKKDNPKVFLEKLRSDTKSSEKMAEHLVVSITTESDVWSKEFIEGGGVTLIANILSRTSKKEKKKQRDLNLMTQLMLSLKGLMKTEEGLEAVLKEKESLESILGAFEYFSPRGKINAFNMFAVACVVNEESHKFLLDAWIPRVLDIIKYLSGESGLELRIACLTFLNALISLETHDLEGKSTLYDELVKLGINDIIIKMRNRDLPESLETQLDIFEASHDIERPVFIKRTTKDANKAYKVLEDQLKNTKVFENFVNILQHLSLVKRSGSQGMEIWDILDRIVQSIATLNDKDGSKKITLCKKIFHKTLESLEKDVPVTDIQDSIDISSSESEVPTSPSIPPPPTGEVPPPPPPPGGGPPPPPPPPGGGPPPPPPPGGAPPPPGAPAPPPSVPQKRKIIPNKKMRNFNWNMINVRKIKDTIWEEIDDEKVKFDISALEEYFAQREVKKQLDQDPEAEEKKKKKELITVLDMKRSQNISIMLSQFPGLDFGQIKKAVLSMDEKVISLENLQAMQTFIPTPEEIELLKEHVNTPISNLGKSEGYFITIMNIPLFGPKLKAWECFRSFKNKVEFIENSIKIVSKAVRAVRNSKSFKYLLEFILAVGNYMNGGTNRGASWGFKLDSLNKMLDVKSSLDSKVSLMHWLVEQMEQNHPDVINITEELKIVELATRENIPNLLSDINKLKGEVNQVSTLLKNPSISGDKYETVLSPFSVESEAKMKEIQERFEKLSNGIKDMLLYFGEDPKTEADEFFSIICGFINGFDRAKKDNDRRKALIEKAKIAEEKKKNAMKSQKKEDILENMLSELVSGEAFSRGAAQKKFRLSMLNKPKDEIVSNGEFKLPTLRKVERPQKVDEEQEVSPLQMVKLRKTSTATNSDMDSVTPRSQPINSSRSSNETPRDKLSKDERKPQDKEEKKRQNNTPTKEIDEVKELKNEEKIVESSNDNENNAPKKSKESKKKNKEKKKTSKGKKEDKKLDKKEKKKEEKRLKEERKKEEKKQKLEKKKEKKAKKKK